MGLNESATADGGVGAPDSAGQASKNTNILEGFREIDGDLPKALPRTGGCARAGQAALGRHKAGGELAPSVAVAEHFAAALDAMVSK